MDLKIDYGTENFKKSHMTVFWWHHKNYVTENTSSKWRHKKFPFLSPSLSKILAAQVIEPRTYIMQNCRSDALLLSYRRTLTDRAKTHS